MFVGFNRVIRLMEELEVVGVIGLVEGIKLWKVLMILILSE